MIDSGLSAVVICQNSEVHLRQCLESLVQVSDDIIVVDHYSEDHSVGIAKEFDCRVFSKKWTGYSSGKNYGNAKAKYDWILSVDSDEELSDELIRTINTIHPDDPKVSYAVNRLSCFCGHWVKYGAWYPDRHIRLFNRMEISWNPELVHETLSMPDTCQTHQLKGHLLHYAVDSLEQHKLKVEQYARLGAQKMFQAGRKASQLTQFLNPPFRIFIDYFVRRGFLDGKAGWHIARLTAREKWLKYKQLRQLYKNTQPNN